MSILKELYDSEINFTIATLWHGMEVKLGDSLNGFDASTAEFLEWQDAEDWLERMAVQHYPESNFAKRRQGGA